jgi:hypothetical protein
VTVLKELSLRHIKEEEEELIAKAERSMDAERLEELGQRMEDLFEDMRAEDPRAVLAQELQEAMPGTTRRRAPAKKGVRRAAAKPKRAPAQRAVKAGRAPAKAVRAPAGRAPAGRAAAPAKKAAPTKKRAAGKGRGEQRAEGARGMQARGKTTRGTRRQNGPKGGRSSATSR